MTKRLDALYNKYDDNEASFYFEMTRPESRLPVYRDWQSMGSLELRLEMEQEIKRETITQARTVLKDELDKQAHRDMMAQFASLTPRL